MLCWQPFWRTGTRSRHDILALVFTGDIYNCSTIFFVFSCKQGAPSESPGSSQPASHREPQHLSGPPFLRYAHINSSEQLQCEELSSVFCNYPLAEASYSRLKSPKGQHEKLASKESFWVDNLTYLLLYIGQIIFRPPVCFILHFISLAIKHVDLSSSKSYLEQLKICLRKKKGIS